MSDLQPKKDRYLALAAIEQPKEIHNTCTLYGANPDGSESKEKLLSLATRPQDWGDPRWHYEQIRVQRVTATMDYQKYVFVWHLWTDLKREPHELLQLFGGVITWQVLPGMAPEKCGRTHLTEDDFWDKKWGTKPSLFEEEHEPDWDWES